MKILFLSDIHGIGRNLHVLLELDKKEKFDKVVILGDVYYNYSSIPSSVSLVSSFINYFSDRLIMVRGNGDNDSSVSLLEVINDDVDIYVTHGHIYNKSNFAPDGVLVYGHLHYPFIEKALNTIYINTGSISLPRKNYPPTFVIYDKKRFTIYDIFLQKIDSISIKNI